MRFFTYLSLFAFIAVVAYGQSEGVVIDKITREDAVFAAFSNNPAYQASIEDRQSAGYRYFASWSAFLPNAELAWNKRNIDGRNFSVSESYTASAGINLFRGFRSYNDIKIAGLNYDSISKVERETFLRMTRDVNLAYMAALKADYLRRSSRTLFESAELVLNEADIRQGLDLISRADLYQARADREKAYSSLIDAEVNYDASILELVRLTGLNIDNNTVLEPDNRVYLLYSLKEYKEAALSGNIALRRAYIAENIAARSYYSSWGAFLPSLDASAGTGWYIDEMGEYNSRYVGLTASWNIFSGLYDTGTLLAAAKSRNSSRLAVAETRDSVVKEVEVAWLKARASREKERSAEIYVSAANENYITVQEMFRLGRASLKDTVDARATLEDAQAALADVKFIIAQAYEELILLTGGALSE